MKTKNIRANLDGVKFRWQNRGYRVTVRTDQEFDCVDHSYGKVHDYFTARDCDALVRVSGEFRDRRRNVVLVAFSWVRMPTIGEAARFKALVDTGGTGNVTELSRDRGLYRNVRYAGLGYGSGIDGPAVWNIQVQPVGPAVPGMVLGEMRGDVLAAATEAVQSS